METKLFVHCPFLCQGWIESDWFYVINQASNRTIRAEITCANGRDLGTGGGGEEAITPNHSADYAKVPFLTEKVPFLHNHYFALILSAR